jgi:hypothetical protein
VFHEPRGIEAVIRVNNVAPRTRTGKPYHQNSPKKVPAESREDVAPRIAGKSSGREKSVRLIFIPVHPRLPMLKLFPSKP